MIDAKKIRDIVITIFSLIALIGLGVLLYIFQNKQNEELNQVANEAQQQVQQANSAAEYVKAVSGEGVVINEVSSKGWIELMNTAKDPAQLEGMVLIINDKEIRLEAGELQKGDYHVVDLKETKVDEELQISLINGSGLLLQSFFISGLGVNESYAAESDGGQYYTYKRGSKGTTNNDAQLVKKKYPVFKLPAGYYDTDIQLEIQVPEGSTVYYTMDGSEPNKDSIKYEEAIALSNATWNANVLSARTDVSANSSYVPTDKMDKANIIRAVAIDDKGNASEVVTETYFVSIGSDITYTTAPVISIITEEEGLFNYWNGIYIKGRGYDDAIAMGANTREASNYCKGGKVTANFEFFDNSERKFAECTGDLSVYLDYNVNQIQKSLVISLGESELLLSAGEEDYVFRMRNPILNDLLASSEKITQNNQAFTVFINGEYWGLYFAKEIMNPANVAYKLGTDAANIQTVCDGQSDDPEITKQWIDILQYAMVNDMTDANAYAHVAAAIDLESMARVYAYNIYFGNPNFNATAGSVYRDISQEEPKWTYMVCDLENTVTATASSEYTIDSFLYPSVSGDYVLYSLMRNEEFRSMMDVALTNVANKTVTCDKITPIVEDYVKRYENLIVKTHGRFFGMSHNEYFENVGQEIIDYVDNRWGYLEIYLDEFLEKERPLLNWKLGEKGYEIVTEEETKAKVKK